MANVPAKEDSSQAARKTQDPVNYGVELEFVFAFHENQVPRDKKWQDGTITTVKQLSYEQRSEDRFSRCDPRFLPNKVYNSWGRQYEKIFRGGFLNPYEKEPLTLTADILREKCTALRPLPNIRVFDTLTTSEKKKLIWNNTQWKITKDHSVCGVGSENIAQWLPSRNVQGDDAWDSIGIELISPILKSNQPADKGRISDILAALKGDKGDQTGTFVTNQCGFHVHVQAPQSDDFLAKQGKDIDRATIYADEVKKELAMILLVYEEEIARLHPPCRRPGHPNAERQVQSNRLGLIKEGLEKFCPSDLCAQGADTSLSACIGVDCSTTALSKVASIPAIRQAISEQDDVDMIELLNWPTVFDRPNDKPNRSLGDRDRQVNLTYLKRPPPAPRTIEFRQAKGSLDAEDVSRWIDFCIGLVHLARLYVDDPSRFRVKNWSDTVLEDGTTQRNDINVFDLIDDMELGDDAYKYWEHRIAKFMCYRVGDENDRLDDEEPPAGYVSMRGGAGGSAGGSSLFGTDSSGSGSEIGSETPSLPEENPASGLAGPFVVAATSALNARGKRPADTDDDGGTSSKKPNTGSSETFSASAFKTQEELDAEFAKQLHDEYSAEMAGDSAQGWINNAAAAQAPYLGVIPDYFTNIYDYPVDGQIAPAGILSPDESMLYDGFSWQVNGFNLAEWDREETAQEVQRPGQQPRNAVCPCNALVQSMKAQYPNSRFAQAAPHEVLYFLDAACGGMAFNTFDTQIAEALRLWSGGEFVMVFQSLRSTTARRVGDLEKQQVRAQNLYLRHTPARAGRREHWESMRKR